MPNGIRLWWVAVALLLWTPQTECREVTIEDIRDVLMTLVHLVRATEDKLERHEFREKMLGEQVKKMLMALDKKHRMLEPLKGMISRLDQRLSNVETILLQKEEREKDSQKKTDEALESIQKSILALTTTVTENAKENKNTEVDSKLESYGNTLERRLNATDARLEAVKTQIDNLKNTITEDNLRTLCQGMAYDENPLKKHLTEAEKLLNKYELKLVEYNSTSNKNDVEPINEIPLADEQWHSKMAEVMERQEIDIKNIQKILIDAESMWKDLPRVSQIERAHNETLEAIVNATEDIKANDEKSVDKVNKELRAMSDRLQGTNVDIQKSLTQSNTLTERAFNDIWRSYDMLRNEMKTLTKSEEVILQTADNVIAAKQGIEYGVQKILIYVGDLIKTQTKTMNRTVSERFDVIHSTVIDKHNGTLVNLNSKIEMEMSQVWRQIGIMHQQLTASQGSLNKLTELSESYTNSSTITLNKVKDEVGNVTNKVLELGENLNYVLGRLALVTQEFSQISTGLSEALMNLKNDGNVEEKKEKVSGPGPHEIKTENKP